MHHIDQRCLRAQSCAGTHPAGAFHGLIRSCWCGTRPPSCPPRGVMWSAGSVTQHFTPRRRGDESTRPDAGVSRSAGTQTRPKRSTRAGLRSPRGTMIPDEWRRRTRQAEIELIVESLQGHLSQHSPLDILEFGSGTGVQAQFLRHLGRVTASDVRIRAPLRALVGLNRVQCRIDQAPFSDHGFDLIFSNHTIEHLSDAAAAFAELLRIGKPDCVYAFSVPTHVWLLLSVPAQYRAKLRFLADSLRRRLNPRHERDPGSGSGGHAGERPRVRKSLLQRVLSSASPHGHGIHEGFLAAYRAFHPERWRSFIEAHGFRTLEMVPLLLYGSAKLPLIPTLRAPGHPGLCASLLFVLRRR
jgi:SAM-dependent methyltransferase